MVRLRRHERAGDLVDDVAGQFLLEAHAREGGLSVERKFDKGALSYQFAVGVPASSEERGLRVEFVSGAKHPAVFADGPRCLRHRWGNDSLCMWDPNGPENERWVCGDGLPALVTLARLHMYCEAECRAGRPWFHPEMVGEHPRKRECPSCRGCGR